MKQGGTADYMINPSLTDRAQALSVRDFLHYRKLFTTWSEANENCKQFLQGKTLVLPFCLDGGV